MHKVSRRAARSHAVCGDCAHPSRVRTAWHGLRVSASYSAQFEPGWTWPRANAVSTHTLHAVHVCACMFFTIRLQDVAMSIARRSIDFLSKLAMQFSILFLQHGVPPACALRVSCPSLHVLLGHGVPPACALRVSCPVRCPSLPVLLGHGVPPACALRVSCPSLPVLLGQLATVALLANTAIRVTFQHPPLCLCRLPGSLHA
jgi:hypothetical protein